MLLRPVLPREKERASTKVERHLARMQYQKDTMGVLVVTPKIDLVALITI
jgi:hypothetical protein